MGTTERGGYSAGDRTVDELPAPPASVTAPRICGFCNRPAVWRWKPKNPPAAYHSLLCDDHAAKTDLDELEELAGHA